MHGLGGRDGTTTGLAQPAAPGPVLPGSSLFAIHPEPNARFVVETDPRFASYRQWLSSDYMLSALAIDPATTQKRLGDGFYEQKLIREQVASLTGQRFLGDYRDDEAQYRALMSAGVTFAQAHQLRPGIALSAAQVAQLTSDIVWLEARQVLLPDGRTTMALVPQVYLVPRSGDLHPSGALLAASDIDIRLTGDLSNSGTIQGSMGGRRVTQITAQNVANLGGRISGSNTAISAAQDISNIGGIIEAGKALVLHAGRNLEVASTTQSTQTQAGPNSFKRTSVDRLAGLYVSDKAGTLIASAGQDVNLIAAVIDSAGTVQIGAGRDLNLGTVRTERSDQANWNASNHLSSSASSEVGTQIQSQGNTMLRAGQDINARAADVQAQGSLGVQAGRDVNLSAGQSSQGYDQAHQSTSKGFLSSQTITTRNSASSTSAQASELSGRTVAISSGRDTRIAGPSVIADQDLSIHAGRDLSMEAAQNTHSDSSFSETKKSGLGALGGISFGKSQQSQAQQNTQTTAAASTVGSVGGNVSLSAGQTYTQRGSDVVAPGRDISISAQRVTIEEARETTLSQSDQKAKQSGLSVSVGGGVIAAAQGLASTVQATGNTGSTRMQALGAATAALQARELAAQGQNLADLANAQSLTDVGKASGASISVSLGSSKSQSNNRQSSETARGSSVNAGGDVSITASGAGTQGEGSSDITVQGSEVKAGGTTRLKAEGDVQLLAAANTHSEANSQSSKSGSIGVSIAATGVSVNASASRGKGAGAGQSTTYTNSHVSGNTVLIESGGDTSLKGAVVQGDRVAAKVGGELTIESLQDSSRYQESSKSAGLSVSVPVTGANVGTGAGASVSAGKTRISSNYQSVTEQSGIRAGDGGFQVEVGGKTTLAGGAITSGQAAVENNKNSFSSAGGLSISDVQNTAAYKADSSGITVGVGSSLSSSGAGVGSDKGQASSTTQAAISGVAGDTTARTGDVQTGITPIFNKDQVKQDINAQAAITAEFFKQAPKAWADHAQTQQKAALARGDLAEAEKWAEGGAYRNAGHTLIGALGGGVSGATGALLSASAMPEIGKLIDSADLPVPVKQALGMVTSATLGAVAGTAGAAAAFGVDTNNRQLHPNERKLAQDLARKSGGKYTPEQIEEQMRLMGNLAFDEKPNTPAVLVGKQEPQDSGLPTVSDGISRVEITGQANMGLQQFIISNSLDRADYIPGVSPYIASDPTLNKPMISNRPSNTTTTAACANGDLACKSGVGVQQNAPLTIEQKQALGKYMGDASTTYQRAAAMATATGHVQIALTFEIASGVAAVLEQAFAPSVGKVLVDTLIVDEAAKAVAARLNVPLPIVVEVVEREIKPKLQRARDSVDQIGRP